MLGSLAGDETAVIAARACGIASLVAALLAALLLPNTPVVRPTGRKDAPAMAAPVADAGE
jgi:hypothetical protein